MHTIYCCHVILLRHSISSCDIKWSSPSIYTWSRLRWWRCTTSANLFPIPSIIKPLVKFVEDVISFFSPEWLHIGEAVRAQIYCLQKNWSQEINKIMCLKAILPSVVLLYGNNDISYYMVNAFQTKSKEELTILFHLPSLKLVNFPPNKRNWKMNQAWVSLVYHSCKSPMLAK